MSLVVMKERLLAILIGREVSSNFGWDGRMCFMVLSLLGIENKKLIKPESQIVFRNTKNVIEYKIKTRFTKQIQNIIYVICKNNKISNGKKY